MSLSRSEKNEKIADEIESLERKEKNKKVFKILFWIFMPLFILLSLSYIFLRFVGNMGIVVREYPIYSDMIDENINGIKIIHFSDIHYNQYMKVSNIKKIVNLINKANPDIVVFTGDLIDSDYDITEEDKNIIMSEFNDIKARIGKYAIKGEEDLDVFNEIFDNSGFKILDNTLEQINIGLSTIDLIAVDDTYSIESINGHIDNNYTIVLVHKPDVADRVISDFNPNLILAGHSHNGQIVLPLMGPVIRKEGAKKYVSSYYQINNTELYISGGIGNSNYQFRLFNHPSINFYRLRTSK